jgi:anti-anti-sigma factor
MANVSLSTREHGGYVVIALQGELDIVDAASVMAVLAAAAAGNPRIIVDLAALEFIDCCALGVLAGRRSTMLTP